ncbi:hypothetical protein [Streptomyces sp. NPDC056491]|uniref:hypothetical protein n=1 Tax=Streptomyces sp. NPDC056491 TaxID=3345837 RepID=UPI0036C812D4
MAGDQHAAQGHLAGRGPEEVVGPRGGFDGAEQRAWLCRLDAESLNLRAALDHATAAGAAPVTVRLVNASAWYWCLRGRIGDARGALESALACAAAEGGQAAAAGADVDGARARLAAFAVLAGDGSLQDGGLESDPTAASTAPTRGGDGCWSTPARLGFAGGAGRSDAPADAVLDGLIAVFRNLGDRWGEAAALSTLATRALYRGDLAELRSNAEVGSRLFGELGDQWGRLQASEQLGILAEIDGDYAEAARLHEDGVRSARELELWTQVSFRLSRQGRIALPTVDTALAADLHGQAGRLAEEQSHRPARQFAEIGLALGPPGTATWTPPRPACGRGSNGTAGSGWRSASR